jgi:hypothetical protein
MKSDMGMFEDCSIKSKLAVITMSATILALVLASAALVTNNHLVMGKSMVQRLNALVDASSTAALVFDDYDIKPGELPRLLTKRDALLRERIPA